MTVSDARRVYRELRERAKKANPAEVEYIDRLWGSWDRCLAEIGDDVELPADHLVLTVQQQMSFAEAHLEWMDAFPAAIADMGLDVA